MKERSYQEILDFFREVLKIEIDDGISVFESHLSYMKDKTKKKLIYDSYGKNIYNAFESLLKLNQNEHVKILLGLYVREFSRYLFKRLEEGENIKQGERINFELTAVNEVTGQRTKLISANPDEDGVNNNFQEWIMDNCSGIVEQ